MAAGYLDLLQRELRNAVPHPFPSVAVLAGTVGTEGQLASTEGSFYIFTGGVWRRIVDEVDLAVIEARLDSSAGVFKEAITSNDANPVVVAHGFMDRPVVEVTGPDGAVIDVDVVHGDGAVSIGWRGVLPVPSMVTCVGVAAGSVV